MIRPRAWILSLVVLCFAQASNIQHLTSSAPTTLLRTSKAGETLDYSIKSRLQDEFRGGDLLTWMPQEIDLNYDFSTLVKQVTPGGMMVMEYRRPSITEVLGETLGQPERRENSKVADHYLLTVSPINEIVSEKNLGTGGNKAGKKDKAVNLALVPFTLPLTSFQDSQPGSLITFIREIYRLALNVGSFDSALDFAPKLPIDSVNPGDTWKKTVGYSPQVLKDHGGSAAIQRLDYIYTFKGVGQFNGEPVYRITADLNLQTDLVPFFRSSLPFVDGQTIKSIALNLNTHIDFDLDKKTGETLHAESDSSGGLGITINGTYRPLREERFKGTTEMRLLRRSGE